MLPVFDCHHGASNPELSVAPRNPAAAFLLTKWLDRTVIGRMAEASGMTDGAVAAAMNTSGVGFLSPAPLLGQ